MQTMEGNMIFRFRTLQHANKIRVRLYMCLGNLHGIVTGSSLKHVKTETCKMLHNRQLLDRNFQSRMNSCN